MKSLLSAALIVVITACEFQPLEVPVPQVKRAVIDSQGTTAPCDIVFYMIADWARNIKEESQVRHKNSYADQVIYYHTIYEEQCRE